MKNNRKHFKLDKNKMRKELKEKERDLEDTRRSTKSGSGEKPEELKFYNRYQKVHGKEPITTREYLGKQEIREDIEYVQYEIQCTIKFFKNVFHISLDEKRAAQAVRSCFVRHIEEGVDEVYEMIDRYTDVLHAIRMAKNITPAKLQATFDVLEKLEEDIPDKLWYVKEFHEKYAKNQQRKALSDAIKSIFQEITKKDIIEEITANNLP